MKLPNNKKRPLIITMSLLLAVIVTLSSLSVLFYVITKQDKAIIIDKTKGAVQTDVENPSLPNNESEGKEELTFEHDKSYADEITETLKDLGDDDEAVAFASGVSVFTDESGDEINDSVIEFRPNFRH